VLVPEETLKSSVKGFRVRILTHDPGHGNANFWNGMLDEFEKGGIPLSDFGVAAVDPIGDLGEGVLDSPGPFAVCQIQLKFRILQHTPKPGSMPKKKRDDYAGCYQQHCQEAIPKT
jgi:hypothetical protein